MGSGAWGCRRAPLTSPHFLNLPELLWLNLKRRRAAAAAAACCRHTAATMCASATHAYAPPLQYIQPPSVYAPTRCGLVIRVLHRANPCLKVSCLVCVCHTASEKTHYTPSLLTSLPFVTMTKSGFELVHSAVQSFSFKMLDQFAKELEGPLQAPDHRAKIIELLALYRQKTKAASKAALGKGKGRKGKGAFANSGPKRQLSKYNLFFQEKMKGLAKKNPSGNKAEMMRQVAAMWKAVRDTPVK